MSISNWSAADLERFLDARAKKPAPATTLYPELAANPSPPVTGAITFVIANNGAGKREKRTLYPTGVFQVESTEP